MSLPVGNAVEGASATDLYVGFACNNRCVFCAQGDLRREAARVDGAEIRAAIDRARGRGIETLFWKGGEPTLLDELPALMSHARRSGIRSSFLQTNGRRLAYRMYAEALARSGLQALDISLHGPRADIHDYHTGVSGSWGQTVRGIGVVRDLNMQVGITTVVTRSNFRHLEEQVDMVAELRVQALHLSLARPRGTATRQLDSVVPRLRAVAPRLAAAGELARRRGLPLAVSGVPPCLLSGLAECAFEPRPGDADASGYVRGEPCGGCALRDRCPGVDRAYAGRFGFDEIEPLTETGAGSLAEPGRALPAPAFFGGIGVTEPQNGSRTG